MLTTTASLQKMAAWCGCDARGARKQPATNVHKQPQVLKNAECKCSPDQAALGSQDHVAKIVDETLDTVWIPLRILGDSLDTVDIVRGV